MVDDELVSWKNAARRKPLIVRGARQVGKTTSIERFGRQHFDELAAVDLERNRSWHRVFAEDLDAKRILSELRILLDRAIVPGKTLLFLDEIQACPRAIMALRYLFEEAPELHVIAAGSLLEFALSEISFPVGRVQFGEMYPLCFAEYLWAIGKERAADVVLSPPTNIPDTVHKMLLEEVRKFLFVGGMPESVHTFAANGSFRECFEVQRELCHSYRQDFSKYASRSDPYCLDTVFQGIARRIGQPIKYTRLAEGYSIPTVKRAFDLLVKARVARRVPSTSPAGLPLGAGASDRKFKALMVDVGLVQQLRGLPMEVEHAKPDLLAIHEGALAEQFVGQELLMSQGSDLFYWAREARSSTAEVDFLSVIDGAIVPIEVKRGPSGRLRSLHLLLEKYPNVPRGLVFSSAPYADLDEQRLRFVPLYHAFAATRSRADGD